MVWALFGGYIGLMLFRVPVTMAIGIAVLVSLIVAGFSTEIYILPLMVVEGHMQYVWDETGKQYLDAFAGVATISVGHCHPDILARVREQTGQSPMSKTDIAVKSTTIAKNTGTTNGGRPSGVSAIQGPGRASVTLRIATRATSLSQRSRVNA